MTRPESKADVTDYCYNCGRHKTDHFLATASLNGTAVEILICGQSLFTQITDPMVDPLDAFLVEEGEKPGVKKF